MVDSILIMTYDQHYAGSSAPGSVAGLQWVEEGIKEFLSYGISRDKLYLGIPFYVREWTVDSNGKLLSNRAVLLKQIPNMLSEKKPTITWDEQFKQNRVEYMESGNKRIFWLENEDTVKAKMTLAKKYSLAGVAAWRLDYNTPALWNMMIQEK